MAGVSQEPRKKGRNVQRNEFANTKGKKGAAYKHFVYKKKSFTQRSKKNTKSENGPFPMEDLSHPRNSMLKDSWSLYFPDEDSSVDKKCVEKIEILEKYFKARKHKFNKEEIEMSGYFWIDANEIFNDPELKKNWSTIREEFEEFPERLLLLFGVSMHHVLSRDLEMELNAMIAESVLEGDEPDVDIIADCKLPRLFARIKNFEPLISLKNLKANYYGKLVAVKGTVVRVSNLKPLCRHMAFRCMTCGTVQLTVFPDGKFICPIKCIDAECCSRLFEPDRSSKMTETVDWQTIRIQEMVIDDQREAGRIPRTIECELTCDLVDSCIPGDVIVVTGVAKVICSSEGGNRPNKDSSVFTIYIHANSVINCKGKAGVKATHPKYLLEDFTLQDLYEIKKLHTKENLFHMFISSLCPTIYGHEMVKAGLILGLFGGTQKHVNDRSCVPVRGDPHILVVGDPGLGKSQMLQTCSVISPRGVYVCGNTTTTSGLTVTVCKENAGSDYVLEAGALVLADQGCCCIDEFDKMSNQHQALLEAMEQQSISVAKAGIICSLPARTSILAAANPAGGHYNRAKTVAENLKMGSALLSRFDLVFILLDKPDEHVDSLMSHHVMALHSGLQPATASLVKSSQLCLLEIQENQSLSEKLKSCRNSSHEFIPHHLFRNYVSYARKYVQPRISPEAAECLQSFYLELRHKSHVGTVPITTRQLESMIRLTEARARVDLRETAILEDAKDVIDIMKYSMIDTFLNENGILDFHRSQHGSGMSCRSQAKRFIDALDKIALQTSSSLFSVQQMQQVAKDIGIQVRSFGDFLHSLNNQNYLLKKGPRLYQLLTATF